MLFSFNSISQIREITRGNFDFISYPGFPEQNSIWRSIGYSGKYNKVFVVVTNHYDNQVLYAYDVEKKKMENLGFLSQLAGLRKYEWQGKVHSKIEEGPNGEMYFSTDGGEDRQEYLMNHPHGYGGGFFMKWNPEKEKMTVLSKGLPYESIKNIVVDNSTGEVYGISYPQVHFMKFNPLTNNFKDLGRLGSSHVPRELFSDKWGNIYYVDWRQRLVKYEKETQRFVFGQNSLPMFPNQPGNVTVTGLMAYAKDTINNIIYLTMYNGKLVGFHPRESGIGIVEDLGGVVPQQYLDKDIEPWRALTPDLAIGKDGKLYYFVGSEGRFVQKDKILFMEYDPGTRNKRLLQVFTTSEIRLASGVNTTDRDGNMYFGIQSIDHDTGKKIPYLVKFNPDKSLRQ